MKSIRLLKCMLLAMLMMVGFGAKAQDVGLEWAKAFLPSDTNGSIRSYGADTDANGNVYLSGFFGGTVDFNPGAGVANLTAPTGWQHAFIHC